MELTAELKDRAEKRIPELLAEAEHEEKYADRMRQHAEEADQRAYKARAMARGLRRAVDHDETAEVLEPAREASKRRHPTNRLLHLYREGE